MDEIEKKSDLKLVLNGGSRQMDGATIPVKWFFSEELARKKPTHILLIDLEKGEEKYFSSGRRYVVKVEEVVKFIQLFRSGHHTMLALAFKDKYKAYNYLTKNDNGLYNLDVVPDVIKGGELWEDSLATTYVEFEVPKELFASKPESKLGKLWWNYLFWPKRPKAKDECQIRKLAWFYALPKLPLFILGNLLYMIYTLIAIPIVFFFGFWPINLKETIRRIANPIQNNWDLNVMADGSSTEFLKIYKDGWDTGKKMWFSSFYLLLFFATIGGIIFLVPLARAEAFPLVVTMMISGVVLPIFINFNIRRFFSEKDESVTASILIAVIIFIITAISAYIFGEPSGNKFGYYFIPSVCLYLILCIVLLAQKDYIINFIVKKLSIKRGIKKEKDDLDYEGYLLKNFTQPEEKVTLTNLPKTFEMNQTKRSLKIHFWATKSKICRPFES